MKRTLTRIWLPYIFPTMTVFSVASLSFGANHTPEVSPKKSSDSELIDYFTRSLAGDTATFPKSKKIRLKDIKTYRNKVWQAWKEANKLFNEEKLTDPSPLSEARKGQWRLPQELESDAIMPYYWGTKNGNTAYTSKQDRIPLFLYLHGSGPKETEWATGLKICQQFDDAPSAYFIPQIPNENHYRWWQQSKQYAWEKLLRQALLSEIIDPNRIYLFGISEGGYGSQRLASFYADYLAGAGPMAGGEPLKNAPAENCGNLAFSLLTGSNDKGFYRNILTSYVQEAFDSLQNLHPTLYKHRIELIPGKGHGIDYKPTTPWLKIHKRNPYPKFVSWENFEMDGRFRKGFYNLYVGTPHKGTRIYYEMDIRGNNVSLRVEQVKYQTTQKDSIWGIEMKFAKRYFPATQGKIIIYLCPELVDLNRPVTVSLNGKEVYKAKVQTNLKHMVNSCSAFYDPERIYPAAVEINL